MGPLAGECLKDRRGAFKCIFEQIFFFAHHNPPVRDGVGLTTRPRPPQVGPCKSSFIALGPFPCTQYLNSAVENEREEGRTRREGLCHGIDVLESVGIRESQYFRNPEEAVSDCLRRKCKLIDPRT